MVIKRKKNCKIIFDNNNYYVESLNYFFKFNRKEDTEYFYNNCKEISFEFYSKFDVEGKLYFDFYPEDVELILKGIEQLKFFLDKSLYFTDNREILKEKSYDCFYLYQYIYSRYKDKFPTEKQNI